MTLDARIPAGPLPEKWTRCQRHMRLVAPANRPRFEVIVVGTGLAGSSAAATLAELGYRVKVFCLQDSPRRAHSIAAQGGINAAKNYPHDGDSVARLFYDTIKGGDFRAREANVHRLAELSNAIIDHCVAQGVPFAREYGGHLANRSFGGAQVSRTFYARGQTGQQLLMGAYGALMRAWASGRVTLAPRSEMMDFVVLDGAARGVIVRDLVSGKITSHAADAVVLATGGYANVYDLSTNARSGSATAIWRAYRRGAFFANPSFVQIHPTCLPPHGEGSSKLTLMSESLRNHGRVWVPRRPGDRRPPERIPESERDYFLERLYPAFGNLVPRDLASRRIKDQCDQGKGVGPGGRAVYLDLTDAVRREGRETMDALYGNLFAMYERITAKDPRETPMIIYPAPHYTMGGLWVDYHLMSTIPGLFVLGEANFSDHGANRLGASALMQGLADGYFILPLTVGDYLAGRPPAEGDLTAAAAFRETEMQVRARIRRLLEAGGRRSAAHFHRRLGTLMWESCGMSRSERGLRRALAEIPALREEFREDLCVPGDGDGFNQSLERAGRVADFLELAELMVRDALARGESCGCHFREESQTPEGEALRRDETYAHVAAWAYAGAEAEPVLHKESLTFEAVRPSQRDYR